jgi:hypothetical protein
MLEDVNRVSIKEGFGTEPKFTRTLAEVEEYGEMLIAKVGYNITDVRITDNAPLVKSRKYPDNVVFSNTTDEALLQIESIAGELDKEHCTKILDYAFNLKPNDRDECVEDCILLCDSASHERKEFIRFMNKYTPMKIWIMVPVIIKVGKEVKIVDFQIIHDALGQSMKSNNSVKSSSNIEDNDNREWAVEFAKKHPKWKLNPCKSWVNTVQYFPKESKYNVTLLKDPGMYKAQFEYRTNSNGRYNVIMLDEDIISTVREVFENENVEMITGTKSKVYGNFDTEEEAWEMYKKIADGVDSNVNLNNRKAFPSLERE